MEIIIMERLVVFVKFIVLWQDVIAIGHAVSAVMEETEGRNDWSHFGDNADC
jgi:hypothetical protein